MPFPRSLTTLSFEHGSTVRFEAHSCKPTSGGLLPSSVQHLKLTLVFVTHPSVPFSGPLFQDGVMNTSIKFVPLVCLFISACAAMYGSPEERRRANAARSDYSLCENLALVTMAPPVIRSEWAIELQRRGVDCNQYAAVLNSVAQQRQNSLNAGLQMMQQSTAAPTSAGQLTCYKVREWTSGFNKNCVYNCLGSEAVQTIGATDLCPISITR